MSRQMNKTLSMLLAAVMAVMAIFAAAPAQADAAAGEIHVYTRDSSSGTREAFEDKGGFAGELTDLAVEVSSNGDMAVKVGQDPQAIGYVSLTTDFAANNLKPLAYEGVEATEANTVSGDYALARPFSYVTRAAGDFDSVEKEQLVAAFVAYITESEEGLGAVEAAGGIVDYDEARPWEEIREDHPIVDQDNSGLELLTGGSTSVVKTLEAALQAFQPEGGYFSYKVDNTGSSAGYKRTLGDEKDSATRADIGFASREFHPSDEDTSGALLSGVYCLDAVVAVVEAGNPLKNLTAEQLIDIFTGKITEWTEVK